MESVLTIDVEDWFHILDLPSTPPLGRWDDLPSHVEADFGKLLDILAERDVHVTCFFLGYVGKRFPHLVRRASEAGHEIASHGFAHRLIYEMTAEECYEDASVARKILEDAAGTAVVGYRASGFSLTEQVPWFYETLAEAGYEYDSSLFPARRNHGGMKTDRLGPFRIETAAGTIVEVPIAVARLLGKPFCFCGGGYLRLFPYPLIRRLSRAVLAEGRPVTFYVHPREINPDHPRLPMGWKRRFRTYVNLRSTEPKLRAILRDFPVTTMKAYLTQHPVRQEAEDARR
jgi:polysaccharide deacetylase family protein (PEP-CTERM system associated)